MKPKRLLKTAAIVFVILSCLASILLGAAFWNIHESVEKYSAIAQQAHPQPGDDIASLIDYMNSPDHSLRQRNLAVWTIGRIRNQPFGYQIKPVIHPIQHGSHRTDLGLPDRT